MGSRLRRVCGAGRQQRWREKGEAAEDPPLVFAERVGGVDGFADAAAGRGCRERPAACAAAFALLRAALRFAGHGAGSGDGEFQRFAGGGILGDKVWMLGSSCTDWKAGPAPAAKVMLLGSRTPMLCVGSETWGWKVNLPSQ